jgi:hypothetical protein
LNSKQARWSMKVEWSLQIEEEELWKLSKMQMEWNNFTGAMLIQETKLKDLLFSQMNLVLSKSSKAKIESIYLRWKILVRDIFTGFKKRIKKKTLIFVKKFTIFLTTLKKSLLNLLLHPHKVLQVSNCE